MVSTVDTRYFYLYSLTINFIINCSMVELPDFQTIESTVLQKYFPKFYVRVTTYFLLSQIYFIITPIHFRTHIDCIDVVIKYLCQ